MPSIEVAVPFRDNWYFDAVCAGIARRARAAEVDVHVLVEAAGARGRAIVADRFDEVLRETDCIGAISVGFEFTAPQVARLVEHGRPVVVVGGPCAGLPSVFIADAAVAHAATDQLIALGHSSIAHLAGYALSADDFTMRSDRVRGYSEAMLEAGFDAYSHVVPCEFSHAAAYRAAVDMLSQPDRPTAVFAVADELAFAVLDAAGDLGLDVPRDLSVIGIDDHPDAEARGLTTWRQDPEAVGAAAADRVLGRTDEDRQVVETPLIVRTTTAPPGSRRPSTRKPGRLGRLLRGW